MAVRVQRQASWIAQAQLIGVHDRLHMTVGGREGDDRLGERVSGDHLLVDGVVEHALTAEHRRGVGRQRSHRRVRASALEVEVQEREAPFDRARVPPAKERGELALASHRLAIGDMLGQLEDWFEGTEQLDRFLSDSGSIDRFYDKLFFSGSKSGGT